MKEKRGKKHHEPRGVLFVIELLFITVVLHLVFIFLFTPVVRKETVEGKNVRHMIFLDESNPQDAGDIEAFRYWLDYIDPSYFLNAYKNNMFSKTHLADTAFAKPPLLSGTGNYILRYEKLFRPSTLYRLPSRSLSDFFLPLTLPLKSGDLLTGTAAENVQEVTYPLCRDLFGNTIPLIPQDEKIQSLISGRPDIQPTILQLERHAEALPPGVRIVQSSGVKELDVHASRLYSAYALKNEDAADVLYVLWTEKIPEPTAPETAKETES